MRIFLDANVLFSAAAPDSGIGRLVALVATQHTAVTSDFAIEEARRNIELKRPQWETGFRQLQSLLEIVPSVLFALPIELEEKDRPILCTAIRAGCDLLATGDHKHFGHLYDKTIEGATVVTVLGLAQRLASGRE